MFLQWFLLRWEECDKIGEVHIGDIKLMTILKYRGTVKGAFTEPSFFIIYIYFVNIRLYFYFTVFYFIFSKNDF